MSSALLTLLLGRSNQRINVALVWKPSRGASVKDKFSLEKHLKNSTAPAFQRHVGKAFFGKLSPDTQGLGFVASRAAIDDLDLHLYLQHRMRDHSAFLDRAKGFHNSSRPFASVSSSTTGTA